MGDNPRAAEYFKYALAIAQRERNLIYTLFKIVTSPVMKLTRVITPRFIVDQHIGFVALFLLLLAEAALIVAKIYLVITVAS